MTHSVVRLTVPAVRPRRRAQDRSVGLVRPVAGTARGDVLLLRAACLGDAGAWTQLVDAYLPAVWQWILDAGEVGAGARAVNDLVWLRLAQSLPEPGSDGLAPWLHAVVTLECRRSQARRA